MNALGLVLNEYHKSCDLTLSLWHCNEDKGITQVNETQKDGREVYMTSALIGEDEYESSCYS